MDSKGQGAVEYLLLIGGAVLIAAIVIVLLTIFSGPSQTEAHRAVTSVGHSYTNLRNGL